MTERVVCVVVTFERRDLLAESLTAVLQQTRPPDAIIVVDNASTDGTAELVRERFGTVELLTLPTNTGGAGGFAVGISSALEAGADAIWLLDDDTIPRPDALEALLAVRSRPPSAEVPALVASRVVWTDGRDHPMNTPRARPGAKQAASMAAARANCYHVRSASFVSVLVDAQAVRESGLPIADYFLWNDDFEFTARLLRRRTGLLCRDSVVLHKTKTFGASDADPGRRFYSEVRNKIWLFTRSPCLAPTERFLYLGSTVLRWARTIARSRDRRLLLRELWRGLIDGMRSRPRPTAELLHGWEHPGSSSGA